MRRRNWLGLLLVPGLLGGCGGDETNRTTVTFWRHDNASYRKANDDAFAAYMAAHPDVDIKATTVDWLTFTGMLEADLKRDQFTYDLLLVPPSVTCGYAANLMDVPADVVTLD